MNEEIDTTVRGVDDASGQVLTGSTNLAEAAQSLAEGATDQAASVEEMQATINELTSGIKQQQKNWEQLTMKPISMRRLQKAVVEIWKY